MSPTGNERPDLVIRGGTVYDGSGGAGAADDIVVFDPARIADVAAHDEPRRAPAGIHAVYVNGTAVARDGRHTGARPGRGLRRGRA